MSPGGSEAALLAILYSTLYLFIRASIHSPDSHSGLPVLHSVLEHEDRMEAKTDTVYISASVGDKKNEEKSNSEWKNL